MWQRFTDNARKVILLGQEEARRMGSGSVGTEHLLLGLVRANECVAAQVLERKGVSLSKVREEVEQESPGRGEARSGEPNLSPRAKRVLELAADEARRMKHNYIGTEHMLLALLRENDGVAAKVLRKLGLNLEEVRQQMVEYLGPEAVVSPPASARAPRSTPEPDLHSAFDWLLYAVDDEIAKASDESIKEQLKQHRAQIDHIRLRMHGRASSRFELTAEQALRCVNWYKERAINAAEYERAADIRDLKAELEATLVEIRKLLAPKPEGEAMPESETP